MTRRLPLSLSIGMPVLLLAAGGAAGWFMAKDDAKEEGVASSSGPTLPADFEVVAPLRPLAAAPNPIDADPTNVIGAEAYTQDAVEVAATAALEIPVVAGAVAGALDPVTMEPAPAPTAATIVADVPVPIEAGAAPTSPTPVAVARAAVTDTTTSEPSALQVSTPFAAASGYAELCNEVEAGNVPDPQLVPAWRPTLAVLVNQPSTTAISGTWADGTALAKTTMVTLTAHDEEWRREFAETGQQRAIIHCIMLSADEVRAHAADGVAQLRASVLSIGASGQAELNATVTLNVPKEVSDPLFADQVTIHHRGEQRASDGVLYPTVHVRYAIFADAVVPVGSTLTTEQLRVVAEHAFVEGADCTGWAANQQGIDRTSSSRWTTTAETRNVAGQDRPIIVVDGNVLLDPTLPGGWEGSLCIRLQATDQRGDQRFTIALQGATVRSPRTATYHVGVSADTASVDVAWTSAHGIGCVTSVAAGFDAQCTFSARWVPDGVVVRVKSVNGTIAILVPVNFAYCNPDDPLETGDGCSTGFIQPYDGFTLHVNRVATPGALWDDPSNAWKIGSVVNG